MAAPSGDQDNLAIAIIGAVVVAALLLFAAVAAYRAYSRANHPAAAAAAAFRAPGRLAGGARSGGGILP